MSKLTFLILSGASVKQFTISKIFIGFIALSGIVSAVGISLGVYDYYHLRQKILNTQELKIEMNSRVEVIEIQRRQIQKFASEINTLKGKLMALNKFENQVRVIANLNNPKTQDGLFGVGGSAPEDLEPGMALKEKHSSLMREMHGQINQIKQAAGVQEYSFEALLEELDDKKNLLACTPAIWPTKGILTSKFGNRKSPFTSLSEFHKGLDIAAKSGTPIIASADGKVTFAGKKGGYGNMLIINHGNGLVTRYAHLSKILKKSGNAVKRGDKVALMGNTGRSTGPHLHYEVLLNGIHVNPQNYILN